MIELCQRCGEHPVADEGPPSFPFCEACWPTVGAHYSVDENGDFIGFMTEAEIADSYSQAGEAALQRAEEEGTAVLKCLDCDIPLEATRTPEHPLCERCLRRMIAAAIAERRRETQRFQAQGLSNEAIMRIWEKHAGLKWDEATQTHVPDPKP